MNEVVARVPAKINLVLSVGGLRTDGYHDIATVFHAISLYDKVVAAPADEVSLRLQGPCGQGVPTDHRNLAVRAARTLAQEAGVGAGVALRVHKAIPVAAGLAGGSADAAGALLACHRLWELDWPADRLSAVAARVGSDVPFALVGGTAIGTGRGERLVEVGAEAQHSWVVVTFETGLSTPLVYRRLDELRGDRPVADPSVGDRMVTAMKAGDPAGVADALHNDLQEAAIDLRPELAEVLAAGRGSGALGAVVSGSGPTCVFAVRDAAHGADVARALSGLSVPGLGGVHVVTGPATPVVMS